MQNRRQLFPAGTPIFTVRISQAFPARDFGSCKAASHTVRVLNSREMEYRQAKVR